MRQCAFLIFAVGVCGGFLIGDEKTEADDDRIVGGYEVRKNEFPWVAGLWTSRSRRPFCGASLITNRWVLTAAHCVYNKRWEDMKIVLGDHSVRRVEADERHINICSVKVHPYYSSNSITDDIALLELCKTAEFTPAIQPVGLNPANTKPPNFSRVTVAGWGTTTEGGRVSHVLRAVNLKTVPNSQCKKPYPWIGDGTICAAVPEGGKDSCQGDSGGALWWTEPETRTKYQVGIVSSGRGCARRGYPGIYTRVSHYFEWILETMSNESQSSKGGQVSE